MSKVLLRYELLALLRDTRTIFLSVLLPIVLLPILLYTLNRFGQRVGGQFDDVYNIGRVIPSPGLDVIVDDALSPRTFREMQVEDGQAMLKEGHLDLLIKVLPPKEKEPELAEDILKMYPGFAPLLSQKPKGRPTLELLYRSDKERSVRAYVQASRDLHEFRDALLAEYLRRQNVSLGVRIRAEDVSTPQQRAAHQYGPALSAFMVLMLLGGGSVAALDSLAGERERGTLSTLFVSSISRREIALSKFAAVALISVAVALIQILNLGAYVFFGFVKWPLNAALPAGIGGLMVLLTLFTVEAIFTASLLLYISARSSSFKEAQLFFFPTFLVAFALSLSGLMPALVSRSVVSLIPLSGPGVFIPELLSGRLDLPVFFLQVAVHLGFAYLLLRSTLERMEREDFLGGQAPVFGKALLFEHFSQRTLPFFALLCAALFVIPSNFEALTSLQGQGLFNQLILFLLAPYLLLKYYGQSLKDVVPFKMVDLRILLICLLLIPLGQLAATGLSHLLGPLLPAPVKALEMMMELLDIENTPAWQLYLLIGVMPGICEEFAFRGVLLHSLHKRFSPWMLAFVVALVFGFFHVNFFRVMPTAYLGFIMALLTLSTGSVLPAMMVHIGNNSLAVWAMKNSVDFEGMPEYVYFLSFLAQIALVYAVMKLGKGYPGTRWARGKTK